MKEFRVSQNITLRLEGNKTLIYVGGKLFDQCKYLLLNITVDKYEDLEKLESIDEAAEKLSDIMEGGRNNTINIPPEVEFWGHCSNLQVWYESNYNSSLLHRSLAFPLLKKLTDLGDNFAKIRLKEEIAKRLASGYWPVIKYLVEEKFIEYLSREEFLSFILENDKQGQKETNFILKLEKTVGQKFELVNEYEPDYNNYTVKNNHIIEMSIFTNSNINEVLPLIGNLKYIKNLLIYSKDLVSLPTSIGNLRNLELLHLSNNELQKLPDTMRYLNKLKSLNLRNNNFAVFPEVISKLINLEVLDISGNRIRTIPKELGNLDHIKVLEIYDNNIVKSKE